MKKQTSSNYLVMATLAAAILSVSACGGGGGSPAASGGSNPNTPAAPVVPGTLTSILDGQWNMVAHTADVKKIVFTGAKYLAVGSYGYIAESTDGNNWTELDAGTAVSFDDVAVNGVNAVAVPDMTGYVVTSYVTTPGYAVTKDGANWTFYNYDNVGSTDCGISMTSVSYDGSQFVGIFSGSKICTSADGVSWQLQSTHDLNSIGLSLDKIVSGSGKYVITLSSGSAGEIMYMSALTETTTNIAILPFVNGSGGFISNLVFGAGKFVGVAGNGQVSYSSDGISWASTATLTGVKSVSYSASKGFVAIGSSNSNALDKIYSSSNGVDWTEGSSATLPASMNIYQSFVINGATETVIRPYGGAIYSSTDQISWSGGALATKPTGVIDFYFKNGSVIFVADTSSSQLYKSADNGASWVRVFGAGNGRFISMIHDGTRYIASGSEGISYSTDGTNWTSALSYSEGSGVAGVRTASAKLGTTTYYFGQGTTVLTSTDGINFQVESLVAAGGLTGGFTQAVTNDAGSVMIAITSGGSIIRYDGTAWSEPVASVAAFISGFNITLYDIVWTGSQFVVVGTAGTVLTSPDGTTWTSQASWSTNKDITDVLAVGTDLYATDTGGRLASSADGGVSWTTRKDFNLSGSVISQLAYDGTSFFGFGSNFQIGGATLATSTDGILWSAGSVLSGVTGHVFYDAANSRFVSLTKESTNGSNWTAVSNYPAVPLFAYKDAQARLSLSSYGEIIFTSGTPDTYMSGQAYSEDGLSWVIKTGQIPSPGYTPINGIYAKAGVNGTGPGPVYVSTDGINFSPATIVGMTGNTSVNFIKYVNGQYIATADNYNQKTGIYTSPDGSNWVQQAEAVLDINEWAGQLTDIEYDGTQYLFMFEDISQGSAKPRGTMIVKVSADFQTLTLLETGIRSVMRDLIVGANGYTLVGGEGTIATHAPY